MRTLGRQDRRRGMALVIALGVLALLLLAAAGAGVQHRADRARASALLHRDRARLNAERALDAALAALEATAGRDRCATGPASLLPGAPQPHWTLALPAGGEPVLLVSGDPDA